MHKIILKVRYFERGLSKSLKKVTSFFLPNPVPFNRQNYQKHKGTGTCDQPLFRLRNKFGKIPLLVMYYLIKFDDVIKAIFELFQKLNLQIHARQFMTSYFIPLPFALLNLESVEKQGTNYIKLNISRTKRAF